MKKLLLSIAVVGGLYAAQTTVMPYGGYLHFSNSVKDKGYVVGVYGNYNVEGKPMSIELDGEYTHIKYKYSLPSYNQKDLTLIGHYYQGTNYAYKLGVHGLHVSQAGNDEKNDYIVIGGVKYYKYLQYNGGADIYYSKYKHFKVYQLTPIVGYNFGDYNSANGSFYIEGRVDLIRISKSGYTPKQNYADLDLKLSNFKGPWTTTLKASIGKNAYKVANDGFVVYNLGDEYKNAYGVEVNYKLDKFSNVKVGVDVNKFLENDQTAKSAVYSCSYLRAF